MRHIAPSGETTSGTAQSATPSEFAPQRPPQAPSWNIVQGNPNPKTVSLLTKSLYEATLEVDRLKQVAMTLRYQVRTLEGAAAAHAEAAAAAERELGLATGEIAKALKPIQAKVVALQDVVRRYLENHADRSFAKTHDCKLCTDARKLT